MSIASSGSITLSFTAMDSETAMSAHSSSTVGLKGDRYGVTVIGTVSNSGNKVFNIVYSSQFNFTFS